MEDVQFKMKCFAIEAHGRDVQGKFQVPERCIIIKLCEPEMFWTDDKRDINWNFFAESPLWKQLQDYNGDAYDLITLLNKVIGGALTILSVDTENPGIIENMFCLLKPGDIVDDMRISFKRSADDVLLGVRELPSPIECSLQTSPTTYLAKVVNHQSSINKNHVNVFFVLACRVGYTKAKQGALIHYYKSDMSAFVTCAHILSAYYSPVSDQYMLHPVIAQYINIGSIAQGGLAFLREEIMNSR